MFDQRRARWWSSARSGATRARASWWTCSPRRPTGSCATRAARTPATPCTSATSRSCCTRSRAASCTRACAAPSATASCSTPRRCSHEIDELVADGIDVEGRLYVSERAHLVMPYHKLVDKASASSKAIGTTGRGIGPAYEDKVARRGVRVLDLRSPERLRELVDAGRRARATRSWRAFGADVRASRRRRRSPRSSALAPRLLPHRRGRRPVRAPRDQERRGRAARGRAGLAARHRSRHVPVRDVEQHDRRAARRSGVGISPMAIQRALGVVKAYTTRVGNGPLPTELDGAAAERGARSSATSSARPPGRPRRCGWFDGVVVRYAARVNGLTGLAVTKLDVLDTLERLAICTGYRVDGELHTEFPADLRHAGARRAGVRVVRRMARIHAATRARSTTCRARRARISTASRRCARRPSRS